MADETQLREGQVLTGPSFNEPMLVETVRENGSGVYVVGMVGHRSERFRRVTLTTEDISGLSIADAVLSYSGDGRRLRLTLQAYALGIAYEFDPYFGLSISRVDPLPHQLEAVYDHLLKLPSVRFLLADDAGAGKTIMAGLLIRELKLRGLVPSCGRGSYHEGLTNRSADRRPRANQDRDNPWTWSLQQGILGDSMDIPRITRSGVGLRRSRGGTAPDNQHPQIPTVRPKRAAPSYVTVRSGRGEVFCRAGRGRAGLSG